MALINRSLNVVLWMVVWTLVWTPENSAGLVIYRLGGADLPPPPEINSPGVDFNQLPWEATAEEGGDTFQAELKAGVLSLLSYDPNVNIAPGWVDREDAWMAPSGVGTAVAFDGDHSTSWLVPLYICAEFTRYFSCTADYGSTGTLQFALGATFPLDRIVVFSGRQNPGTTVRNIRFHLAPVVPDIGIQLFIGPLSPFIEVRDNRKDSLVVKVPSQPVRFMQVAVGEHNTPWEIQEIEVFARGFVERGTYVSNRIEFDEPAAWGDLRWTGNIDPGAQVLIQTRSGTDDDPTLYWQRTGWGDQRVQISRSQYNRLGQGEQAGTTYDLDNWTLWSAPYAFADSAGTAITSLGPRRFLQFKVDFLGGGDAGGGVDFLEFRASSPPAASALLGEIAPTVADLGQTTQFTYTLRPTLETQNTGFDHLELTSSSARFLSIEAVRINEEEVLDFTSTVEDDRLVIGFRTLKQQDTGIPIEVDFSAAIFRFGTSFNARVFHSAIPLEVPQQVSPGNATDRVEGDRVTVETTADRGALLTVSAATRVFTPNGDGVNDTVDLSYDIFETIHAVAVDIEIRDLAGGLVRSYPGAGEVGRHLQAWDGTNASGQVVAPGVYLYRVVVDADEEKDEQIGTIYAAY